jgi:hypothetical protein
MKNETHHTTRGEAMRWLISVLGEIWFTDERFPSSRQYLYRENSLGKASKRSASPTNARTLVYAFVYTSYFLSSQKLFIIGRRLKTVQR